MIFVYHIHNRICSVQTQEGSTVDFDATVSISKGVSQIAYRYPNKKIVWCHLDYKESLNREVLLNLFHHDKLLLSFRPGPSNFINEAIGYVDESLFVNVNKKVSYPTWQMSSVVGMVDSSVLIAINDKVPFDRDFDYFLNSFAKLAMPLGLLCYSEPQLLKDSRIRKLAASSSFTIFRFVKQHYRTRWVFLLVFNLLIYEKRFKIFPFLASFCFTKRNPNFSLQHIEVESSRAVIGETTIDVIIPTIGRRNYLYDVLKDLSKQTLLPKKVVIVEQNTLVESSSELGYLENELWPFEIKHIFTHQAGVCNARNLALDQVESEWVFLADDDNRFDKTLLSEVISKMRQYGVFVATTCYIQNHESKVHLKIKQWSTFGAGNSFVKSSLLDKIQFNTSMEFGYGEDVDFGMQLRNLGCDVLYFPEPKILHLKAPIGGFRTKPILEWQSEVIQPKPSPTVMLSHILHKTKEQIWGYKTILFLKYFKYQKIKNPIRYLINYRKQWNRSVFWANQLNQK